MKLYYLPGACSLAAHIVAREADLPLEAIKVDRETRIGADGTDFRTINPLGYVPGLVLDDGTVVIENTAVLPYLGDYRPEAGLTPAAGSLDRVRLYEMLGFLGTELHKCYGVFFAGPEGAAREAALARWQSRMARFDQWLGDRDYLVGDRFSVVDAYAFVILGWSDLLGLSLEPWPRLRAFRERIATRPAVRQAMKEEGLPH